jgi:hypothetical protein
MNTALSVLIIIGLGATLVVLGIGIVAMFRGGDFNRRYGNKLMRTRIIVQGATVLLLVLAFLLLRE